MSTPAPDRPQRSDARRNRERLIAAATALFAEEGAAVSLEAVARRAGVGIGTLYRHFPTRDALVEEAYRHEVDQLVDAAGELLATREPDAALAAWTEHLLTYAAAKRGMAEALQGATAAGSTMQADARGRIAEALGALLDAGVAAGTIRPDADPDVVLRALMAIWPMTESPDWDGQARKLIALVLDGLRHGAARG